MTGVVTAAIGSTAYVELAITLALSVKRCSTLPISIITNSQGEMLIRSRYPNVFDHVLTIQQPRECSRSELYVEAKCSAIELTPYETTIFFDSDVVCRRDPSPMADAVGADDFRVCGRLHDSSSIGDIVHNGLPLEELFDHFGIDSYIHCFLCGFVFGKIGGQRIANLLRRNEKLWRARLNEIFGDCLFDEVSLGLLGRQAGISFYAKPNLLYQRQGVDFRWSDESIFIHAAPMRLAEMIRLFVYVSNLRLTNGFSFVPAIHWMSLSLRHTRIQLGRWRRLSRLVDGLQKLVS